MARRAPRSVRGARQAVLAADGVRGRAGYHQRMRVICLYHPRARGTSFGMDQSRVTTGGVMLSESRVEANIPAADIDRAKAFYADKLGLKPSAEPFPGYVRYETSGGTA